MREITLPGVNENYESDLERFEKNFIWFQLKQPYYNNHIYFIKQPTTKKYIIFQQTWYLTNDNADNAEWATGSWADGVNTYHHLVY